MNLNQHHWGALEVAMPGSSSSPTRHGPSGMPWPNWMLLRSLLPQKYIWLFKLFVYNIHIYIYIYIYIYPICIYIYIKFHQKHTVSYSYRSGFWWNIETGTQPTELQQPTGLRLRQAAVLRQLLLKGLLAIHAVLSWKGNFCNQYIEGYGLYGLYGVISWFINPIHYRL